MAPEIVKHPLGNEKKIPIASSPVSVLVNVNVPVTESPMHQGGFETENVHVQVHEHVHGRTYGSTVALPQYPSTAI